MSKTKHTNDKKGNKYQAFSKILKTTEGETTGTTTGKCPICGVGANTVNGKQNLCRNCYFGIEGHNKRGKPKKT